MKYKIGELARQANCQVVTIRYYEREGLLKPPERTEGNYRLYGEDELERLRFIRHCREHGLNLREIRRLLEFSDNPDGSCDWIGALIQKHIAEVDRQIEDLRHLKRHLESLHVKCSGDKKGECGIIENLKICGDCPHCLKMMRKN